MGLSIRGGTQFKIVDEDECLNEVYWRTHLRSFDDVAVGEREQKTGIIHYCYDEDSIRQISSLSYSTYNIFRNFVSLTVNQKARWYWHNIDDDTGFWIAGRVPPKMPNDPYDVPFMDIINFSDAEGVMTAKSIQRLHESFVDAKTSINELERFPTRYQQFVESIRDEYGAKNPLALQIIDFYNEFESLVASLVNDETAFIYYG